MIYNHIYLYMILCICGSISMDMDGQLKGTWAFADCGILLQVAPRVLELIPCRYQGMIAFNYNICKRDMRSKMSGIHSKEMKAYVLKNIYIIITVLFVVASNCEHPRCPSTGEWINNCVSIQWNSTQLQREMNYGYHSNIHESQNNYSIWKKPD